MISPTTEKIIKQFKKANLSLEDRAALTNILLEKLKAVPLENTFIIEGGNVFINSKQMDPEQLINFRESCIALKDNVANKIIHEQIRYLASNLGVYKATTMEELVFYKAALWAINQQDVLLDKIV